MHIARIVLALPAVLAVTAAVAADGSVHRREATHDHFDVPGDLAAIWTSHGPITALRQVTDGGGAEDTPGYLVLSADRADRFCAASAPELWRPRKRFDLRNTCMTFYLREIQPISVAPGYRAYAFIISRRPESGTVRWHLREPLVVGKNRWAFNHVHLVNDERAWVCDLADGRSVLDRDLSHVGFVGVIYLNGSNDQGVQASGALGIDEFRYGMEIERPMAPVSSAEEWRSEGAHPRSAEEAAALTAGSRAGPRRRLFLDDEHVAGSENVVRVYHTATKYPSNPVIAKTAPWEGVGPYIGGTVLHDLGRLRMWYMTYSPGRYMDAYAESEDGLHWEKPCLGLCDFEGSKDNNLVLADPKEKALASNLSVIKRPWEADPARCYIAFFNSFVPDFHQAFATSADGLHWTIAPEAPRGLYSFDEMRVFYDPYHEQYVATCKAADELRGRVVKVMVSADGLDWQYLNSGEPVIQSEETGKSAHQIYNMPVFAYQGLYIGVPGIYHADEPAETLTATTGDVEIAWSRDLVHWGRPPRQGRPALIPLGRSGEFDSGMTMGVANAPAVVGDELWFYYGGWDGPHRSYARSAAIGLAALRLDGFASMRAGNQEGWLITKRETFARPRVTINASVRPGGYVLAELLDESGGPVPGFDRAHCRLFTGDSVRHRLAWGARALGSAPEQQAFAIRFYLRRADLYSYLPS